MNRRDWRQALSRTRRSAFARLSALLAAPAWTAELEAQIEAALIQADLGPALARSLVDELKERGKAQDLKEGLRASLLGRLDSGPPLRPSVRPEVILVVGVNGSGKTTSVARLGSLFKDSGRRVLLAAADTYRAAAGEQLAIWAERLGLELVHGKPGADPGAVVFDAAQAALARDVDVLIVDTSGRMHTRHNLMEELRKVARVAGKVIPGAPHEVLLVLDATTGQNGLVQARGFMDAVAATGVILAKLDTSAKGGVGFAVACDLGLPIRYVGLGEGPRDLQPFDREAFVDGLLSDVALEPVGRTAQN